MTKLKDKGEKILFILVIFPILVFYSYKLIINTNIFFIFITFVLAIGILVYLHKPHWMVYLIIFLIPFRDLLWLAYKRNSLHIINILIVMVFATTLFNRILKRDKIMSPLTIFIFTYLSYVISTIVVSGSFETFTRVELYDLVFASLMVPILGWHIKELKQVKIIVFVILFASILQASLASLQFFGGTAFYLRQYYEPIPHMVPFQYIYGTYEGMGSFAEFMLLAYCLTFALWATNKKYINKFNSTILLSALFFTILITMSRAVTMMVVILPFLILWFLYKKNLLMLSNITKKSLYIVSILVLSFSTMLIFFAKPSTDRIIEKFTRTFDPVERTEGILGERSAINRAAIDMFLENPLSGVGFAKFPSFSSLYVQKYSNRPGLAYENVEAHNTYLMNLVENGILGLLLFSGIIIIGLKNYVRTFKYISKEKNKEFLIIFVPFFVYYLSLLFLMFLGYGVYYHLMFILGMSSVFFNMKNKLLQK